MKLRSLAVALGVFAGALGVAQRADAVVVERVVAVVGDRPILLTELRRRATPNLLRILQSGKDDNYQSGARNMVYSQILERMIDERLEEQAAEHAHIAVSSEDIDRGIANVAANAHVSVPTLYAEVHRQGLSDYDFRDEIRRQILEGKLIELRVRPRVRTTEQDARAAYRRWVTDLQTEQPVEMHVLALRVMPGSTEAQIQSRFRLAEELARRGRAGENFCDLIAQFTDDTETRDTCGSRGALPRRGLLPPVLEAIDRMKPGEISEPIRVTMGIDAIVVLQLVSDMKIPTYDDVRQEMVQRATLEALDRQRKLWLAELRRGIYIDVRLL